MLEASSINDTLKEYGRGIVGGLIFSLPMIYTMEVWWTGFIASPSNLIAGMFFTFLLLLGYNRFAGMRVDADFVDLCWDSVEEIGLAFVVSFVFLLCIDRISFEMSINEILGKVIIESMIVAIGISVGTAQLGQHDNEKSGMAGDSGNESSRLMSLIILSICGATLFASTVAPTEEIMMIAIESSNFQLLALVILSILLCAVILYFSEFKGSVARNSSAAHITLVVAISYSIALLVSLILLLFYRRILGNGVDIIVAQVVVLGVPASIGASAGRLLISPKK